MRAFLLFSAMIGPVVTLDCIQCDRNGAWYNDEEQAKHLELCQRGLFQPTPCRNRTHTHCIVSWYRNGESRRVVTERRCGTTEDATGCTLYNSKISRKVRHLITRETSSKRETTNLIVEVCSEACPGGECVSSSLHFGVSLITLVIPVLLKWF